MRPRELHSWKRWWRKMFERTLNSCRSLCCFYRALQGEIGTQLYHQSRVIFVLLLLAPLLGCVVGVKVSEKDYQKALTLVDVGTTKLRELDWDSAQAAFILAEELAPLAAAIDGQGCVAMMLGDFEKAERLFKEAYAADKGYDEALANLALLYDIKGDRVRARELFESFLEQNPDSAPARNNYAAVLDDLGTDKATVMHELLKARALQSNEIVEENITKVVHRGLGNEKEGN